MRNLALIALLICSACETQAQSVTIRDSIIYDNGISYAVLKKVRDMPIRYIVSTLRGTPLIDVHYSRMDIKGTPAYVVTFLRDRKQAMVVANSLPKAIATGLVSYHVILKGNTVEPLAEEIFIKDHPVPEGYIDVDGIIEYIREEPFKDEVGY